MIFPHNLARTTLFLLLVSMLSGCQILKNLDILRSNQKGVYHTVQKGQTLYFIARAYDVEINRLKRINGIYNSSKLQIGTRLWIPGARQVLNVDTIIDKQALTKKRGKKNKKLNKKETPNKNIKAITGFSFGQLKGN